MVVWRPEKTGCPDGSLGSRQPIHRLERSFSSSKTERIERKSYRTGNEARPDLFDHIERFCNGIRRHSTIGYMSN